IEKGGYLVMRNSPRILSNNASWGGGILVDGPKSRIVMEGGTISGNTALSGGGIFFQYADVSFQKGGIIDNNDRANIFNEKYDLVSINNTKSSINNITEIDNLWLFLVLIVFMIFIIILSVKRDIPANNK
ncbi:MAG: hypothetical protein FWD24_07025, partial [Treponema sp.]|nr:hypothetical protein [Treponema sp.]